MRAIADIEADLVAARAARATALSAQSYSLDTGQGKQQVQRANLSEINRTIALLEQELEDASSPGILSGCYDRG